MRRGLRLFRKRGEMECPEVRKLSSDYLEGELPESVFDRFRFHLHQCENCNAFVATLRATINTLRGLPRREASPELKRRILEQMQDPPEAHDGKDGVF